MRPSRSRARRGLVVGAVALSCLAVAPSALAQDGMTTLSGPLTTSTAQVAPATVQAPTTVAPLAAVAPVAAPALAPALAPAGAPAAEPATAPVVTTAMRQAAFLRFTTQSPEATDRRGVEPSLYRGVYYRASVERVRQCIVRRESSGVYTVRGGGGDRYYGAYQMNDELADGATWMMLREAKQLLGEDAARELMQRLRAKPVTTWSRYWQDAAFFTIYNWEHTGSGRAHWAGGRWRC